MKIFKLGDVCLLSKGKTITRATSNEGEVPVIGGGLGPTYFHNIANRKPPVITISASGANAGFVNYWNLPIWASDCTTIVEKSESPALIDYIFKYLQSRQDFINTELRRGSAQPHVYPSDIADLEIPLPSLDRQREIVEKLDAAFAEIDLLEKNFALSEIKSNELLKSILNSEYSSPHLKIEPLEKLVDILDNQRIPINATERLQRVGDVPYYGATGQVGTIDRAIFNETLLLLGEDGVPFFDQTKHKAYEISGPSWVNNHAHVLRAKPGVVVQRYLLHFLNIFNYTGYVNGATRLKLTQGDMKRMPVPLPSLEVQAKIVSKIDLVFEQIGELREQIGIKKASATELRQSILSNVFIQKETVA